MSTPMRCVATIAALTIFPIVGTIVVAGELETSLTDCDRYAASDSDKQRVGPGIAPDKLDPTLAIPACIEATTSHPNAVRFVYQLGRAYQANKDYAKALELYQKASDQKYGISWVGLGTLYGNGQGVARDYKEAVKWFRLAADQGNARGQVFLADHYRNGHGVAQDYKEAAKWYRLAADQGNISGQIYLAHMYSGGIGVAQDYKEAMKRFRLAADQGNAVAQNEIGLLYDNGQGVVRDYKEALKWFRLSADQGNATAQANLGLTYVNGKEVKQDYKEAMKWFRLAAEQKNALAQANLGWMYVNGNGVAQDYKEALKWFRLAADQGLGYAQLNLGKMHGYGQGVAQDYVQAHFWLNVAAAQGQPDAAKLRTNLSRLMTAQQTEQAQEMARKCVASKYRRCGEMAQFVGAAPLPPSSKKSEKDNKRHGTGFFVSNDGYLITNEHVVKSCEKLQAIDGAGQQFQVRVVRVSEPDDLALLKVETERNTVAAFRESAKITQGEAIFIYGYPLAGLLASSGSVSTGVVTALAGIGDNTRQMQISAPVQQGNSGGPLVDIKGAIIGVVVSKLNAVAVARITSDIPQNVNFAIKAPAVINLLDANSVKYRNDASWRDLSVETLTRQMKEYTVKIECN